MKTKEEAANAVTMLIAAGKLHSGQLHIGNPRGPRDPPYDFAVEVQ